MARISKKRLAAMEMANDTKEKIELLNLIQHQRKLIDNLREREAALLNYIQRMRDDPARPNP